MPSSARRALARAELKKRGLRVETDDAKNDAMVAAFKSEVATLPGYSGINYIDAADLLGQRVIADCLTTGEAAFLDGLPLAPISGREYAQAMAEVMAECPDLILSYTPIGGNHLSNKRDEINTKSL